jgi:ribosomal protein L39E
MLVDVSWNEVIKPVEAQLNNLLQKVKVYPQLIYSCQNIAQKLRLLKTLKENGAEPVLFDPECEKSHRIHGIERRYWRLYKLCDAYRLGFYNINNEIVAASNISYRKMTIGDLI